MRPTGLADAPMHRCAVAGLAHLGVEPDVGDKLVGVGVRTTTATRETATPGERTARPFDVMRSTSPLRFAIASAGNTGSWLFASSQKRYVAHVRRTDNSANERPPHIGYVAAKVYRTFYGEAPAKIARRLDVSREG